MVTNACNYNNKVTEVYTQWRWEQAFWAFKNYSNVWSIYQDYQWLDDTKWTLTKAYNELKPFVNNIQTQYQGIREKLVSPVLWDSEYVVKIQKALNTYIADKTEHPNQQAFKNISNIANKSSAEAWDKDLSNPEKQFVKDLALSLNTFLQVIKMDWNDNLFTLVQWCINFGIMWQNIDIEKKQKRSWLWWLLWMVSLTWQWNNNIFWLLGIYDWYVNTDFNLRLQNGETKPFKIRDLYNENDAKMQEMFWLLFASNETWSNDPILQNPKSYRHAIKTLMKVTDMNQNWWFVSNSINWLLKYWAMWKLTSYMFNVFSGSMIWLSCLTTWWLNMMSYKKKNSKAKLNRALQRLWLKNWYFRLWTDNVLDWIWDRLNWYFWTWTKDLDFKDISRDNTSILDDPRISYLLMWPMNILWDTIWRWNYQLIAMDAALQKLWWNWELDTYLYRTDENWKRVPDVNNATTLMTTFLQKMADVTWFPDIEWWSQLNLWLDLKSDSPNWVKWVWNASVNAVLKMMHWMTQRATKYVNNTVHILAWWWVNAWYDLQDVIYRKTNWKYWQSKEEAYNNAYNGIWGNWLIRRYTRWIERWWIAMSWECARELVSKEEFTRELGRILAWIRNLYRLWNIACRDDEWNLDWWCAWDNFWSVVYLPAQALQMAHPIIQALYKIPRDYIKYSNYFEDKDLWVSKWDIFADSFLTNFVKPLLRSMYLIKMPAQAIDKTWNDDLNENWFITNLWNAMLDSTEWILYYTNDELSSYVHKYWAYWPKSYLNDDTSIFWSPLELRDTMTTIWRVKWIESWANRWRPARFVDMFATTRMMKWFFSDEWNTSLYDSWRADKMLHDWNADEDIMIMSNWYFTEDMINDPEFMQYVWTNLTQDRQSYWANFKNWIRDSKYNKAEIDYFETILKKDMDEATIANPWLSDLQIYDTALKTFFEWTPVYEEIKQAIQAIDDSWDSAWAAYADYLSCAAWIEESTWVKWLALIAEYRKRQLMEEAWLQYSSYATAQEKNTITQIENQVAAELWTWLWLADRRQYSNLMWAWFIKNHPEYENYDPFKNLIDKDWNLNMNADLKTSGTLWTALRANNLAKSEMILWNTNWYELSNVFTEKFWSAIDENWDFDNVKAAQIIDATLLLAQALEDSGKSPADISLILAPHLTKNLELWNYVLAEDTDDNKWLRDILWEEWVDQIRWLLYDVYKDTNWMYEFVTDYLNDANVIKSLLWKNSKWYKWWGSLYYWNNTKKNYDYYNKPANTFNGWWSKNLSKLANGYGWTGKRNYAWNYSSREFYFLNQRSYRNNIISSRIAPDIPLSIWGFSKTTVKSKNPVSGFTTNIKPWEERATAKFGKGKSIVWWSWSRWPVSSFKA